MERLQVAEKPLKSGDICVLNRKGQEFKVRYMCSDSGHAMVRKTQLGSEPFICNLKALRKIA